MDGHNKAFSALIEAVKPLYGAMFRRAHAILGNDIEAEEALRRAILACARENAEEGFKAQFSARVTDIALACAQERQAAYARMRADAIGDARARYERDEWDANFECFTGEYAAGEAESAAARALAGEPEDVKRMALLRYACRLSPRQISAAAGADVKRVKSALEALSAKLERAGVKREAARAACERELARERYAPDFNAMMRAVELELTQPPPARGRTQVARAASWLVALASLALLAVILWMGVLLLNYYRELRLDKQGDTACGAVYAVYIEAEEYDARI